MHIRDLTSLEDCRRVVELEKIIWGYTDAEDVVPVPILVVTVKRGGILLGGFDDSERMVGFVYSLAACRDGRLTQWSHMLGVLDEHRSSGLGYRLKLEQRRRAREMGVNLIEWTFDPLQAVNAHLNFSKLGVVAREYEENIYGDSSSVLHRGTPTDRLIAEWWIGEGGVEGVGKVGGADSAQGQAHTPVDTPVVNRTRSVGQWLAVDAVDLDRSEPTLLIEIPVGFTELQASDPELARGWRVATRRMFSTYFARGYRAVNFLLNRAAGRGYYLLSLSAAPNNRAQGERRLKALSRRSHGA
jgi:predicted GNAT superfamily acetyltransferase